MIHPHDEAYGSDYFVTCILYISLTEKCYKNDVLQIGGHFAVYNTFLFIRVHVSIMKSTMSDSVVFVVVSLVIIGVSCMPAHLEKSSDFEAEAAIHHVQRRAPGKLPVPANSSIPCNRSDDNSTKCSADGGFLMGARNFYETHAPVIYRALVVVGSISLIVLAYISFRYFR